jgi:hypothetical protein
MRETPFAAMASMPAGHVKFGISALLRPWKRFPEILDSLQYHFNVVVDFGCHMVRHRGITGTLDAQHSAPKISHFAALISDLLVRKP